MVGNNESVWRLIVNEPFNGSMNMAIDEVLLNSDDPRPVLRLYQWEEPTLSIGMAQQIDRHVNLDYCRAKQIPVIRRVTGGKAVLHSSELTYSLCGSMTCQPYNLDLLNSYRVIGSAFCEAFSRLGIAASMAPRESRALRGPITSCFASSSAYEIMVDGKKLLGSAQKRTRARVLQHGSLLIDYSAADWEAVMLRISPTSSDRVVDLRSLLQDTFSLKSLKLAVCQGFEHYFNIAFQAEALTESELRRANELANSTYRDQSALLDT